jgi:hypothetical protein
MKYAVYRYLLPIIILLNEILNRNYPLFDLNSEYEDVTSINRYDRINFRMNHDKNFIIYKINDFFQGFKKFATFSFIEIL